MGIRAGLSTALLISSGVLELQKNDYSEERESKKETREKRIMEKPGTERGR